MTPASLGSVKHSFKQCGKHGVKHVLRALPLRPLPGARILCYHALGSRRHETTVTAADFQWHMNWLAEHGGVVSLEAAAETGVGVAVTFDDGFANNLEIAAPMLSQLGFEATVFMVAGRAGGWMDGEPDRAQGRLMSWTELQEWRSAGCVVGAHTLTHPRLARLHPEEQRQEIAGSKDLLEDQLQTPVHSFAYPYGSAWDYNPDTMEAVRAAGFTWACTNRYRPHARAEDRLRISRIRIDASDDRDAFVAKVSGRLDGMRCLESNAALRLRSLLNR